MSLGFGVAHIWIGFSLFWVCAACAGAVGAELGGVEVEVPVFCVSVGAIELCVHFAEHGLRQRVGLGAVSLEPCVHS